MRMIGIVIFRLGFTAAIAAVFLMVAARAIFKSSIEFRDGFLAGLAGAAGGYVMRLFAVIGTQNELAILAVGLVGFAVGTALVLQALGGMDFGTAVGLAGAAGVIQTVVWVLLVWGIAALLQ